MEKIGTQLDRLPFHFLPIVRERGNHPKPEKKKIQQSNNGCAYSWGGTPYFCRHSLLAQFSSNSLCFERLETAKFFSPKNQQGVCCECVKENSFLALFSPLLLCATLMRVERGGTMGICWTVTGHNYPSSLSQAQDLPFAQLRELNKITNCYKFLR